MTAHEVMVERLLHVSKVAGRDEVARLAYLMARTCRSFSKRDSSFTYRWFEDIRSVSELRSDLDRMQARVGFDQGDDQLPLANPTSEQAIGLARVCLDFAESIEGNSTRIEFQRAQCIREEGGVEEVVERMESLLSRSLSKAWYQVVQENRQTALLKLGRYESAAKIGRQLISGDARRPDAAFNLVTAQAWMEMDDAFQESAEILRVSLVGVLDHGYWSKLISDEAAWFALQLKRDPTDIVNCLAPPGSLPPIPPRSEP